MKIVTFCFVLAYISIFTYHAISQVVNEDMNKNSSDTTRLEFTNFEIEYRNGRLDFKWDVSNQSDCRYFEIEKRYSGNDFKVIALAFPFEDNADSTYKYFERPGNKWQAREAWFRIKALMKSSSPVYSDFVTPK